MLSWTEIETRAIAFSARWRDTAGDERQYGQTFEKDFMQVLGVDWLDGSHEHTVYLTDPIPSTLQTLTVTSVILRLMSVL